MPRSEVYQLRLHPKEKAALAHLAQQEGMSIARMIRRRFGLSADSAPAPNVAKLPPPEPKPKKPSPPAEKPEPSGPSSEEIETLARQIFYAEGQTMVVARRLARERLSTR